MSGKNGDRSRHDRQRKSKMHDREKIRELRKELIATGSSAGDFSDKIQVTKHLVANWIALLKDAGWMSVMGMVCIMTFAVSSLVLRYAPYRRQ